MTGRLPRVTTTLKSPRATRSTTASTATSVALGALSYSPGLWRSGATLWWKGSVGGVDGRSEGGRDGEEGGLALSHSTRGTIAFVRLTAQGELASVTAQGELASVYEVHAEAGVVAFEKHAAGPALFCVLAGGISQVDLPAAVCAPAPVEPTAPVEPPEVKAEVTEVKTEAEETPVKEETQVSTDVRDAVQVMTETAVDSDHEDAATRAALPSVRPAPSSLGVVPPVNGVAQRSPSPPSAAPAPQQQSRSDDALLAEIRSLVAQLGKEQEQRSADERVASHRAELERQEQVLQTISTSLTKNTSKAVDTTVRAETKSTIMPALVQVVRESFDADVKAGVQDSLQKSLPDALEKLFQRPEVAKSLMRQLQLAAQPLIAETVKTAVNATFVPQLQKTSSALLDCVIAEMRSEMTSIRKATVAEQSTALVSLMADVAALRQQVETLSAPPGPAPEPVAPQEPRGRRRRRKRSPTRFSSFCRGRPRTSTRSRSRRPRLASPSFSPVRLHCQWCVVCLFCDDRKVDLYAQTHLFTMAFKAAEAVAAAPAGPLTIENQIRLRWVMGAAAAADGRLVDPAIAPRLPSIFGQIRGKLIEAGTKRQAAGDAAGVAAVQDAVRTLDEIVARGGQ